MGIELIPVLINNGAPYDFAVKRSVDILWDNVINTQKARRIKRILILDDGGDLYLSIPWHRLESVEICGVEQTQRGINRLQNMPKLPMIVNIAGSRLKKNVESIFIGHSIVDKLKSLTLLDNLPRVGIIGTGSIGRAIANSLNTLGIEIITYDINSRLQSIRGASSVTSIDAVINKVDLVIGCTGENFLRGVDLERIEGKKILISATSADIEFFFLLNMISFNNHNFSDIVISPHPRLELNLLNGGYPINFDRHTAWVRAEDIQITRSLLYVGLWQVLQDQEQKASRIVDLNADIQNEIIQKWRSLKRESDTLAEHITDTIYLS